MADVVWSDFQRRQVRVHQVGNRPGQHRTISRAISAAADGDRVEVEGGRYYESLVVKKRVEIVGCDGEAPEIGYRGTVAVLCADAWLVNVEISQHEKTRETTSLLIRDASPTIIDCRIPSISVTGRSHPEVRTTVICGKGLIGAGVRIHGSAGGTFTKNEISNHGIQPSVEVDTTGDVEFMYNRIWSDPAVRDADAAQQAKRDADKEAYREEALVLLHGTRSGRDCKPVFKCNHISDAGETCLQSVPPFAKTNSPALVRSCVCYHSMCGGTFMENDITGGISGVRMSSDVGVEFADNTIAKQDQYGVLVLNDTKANLIGNRVRDCVLAAFQIQGYVRIRENVITGALTRVGIELQAPAPENDGDDVITVEKNTIMSTLRAGVACYGGAGVVRLNKFSACEGSSILAYNAFRGTITENLIENTPGVGINIDYNIHCTVSENTCIKAKKAGIRLGRSSRGRVIDNECVTCDVGILVTGRSRGVFHGNNVHHCKVGCRVEHQAAPAFSRNILSASMEEALLLTTRAKGEYTNNTIEDSAGVGVAVEHGADPYVAHNTISGNSMYGVDCRETGFGTFVDNAFSNNTLWALRSTSGSAPTFRGNTVAPGESGGILVEDGGSGTYEKNSLKQLRAGVSIHGLDTAPVVARNSIHSCTTGVEAAEQSLGVVIGNHIENGRVGAHVKSQSQLQFTKNRVVQCDSGVIVEGEGSAPTLEKNAIDAAQIAGVEARDKSTPIVVRNTVRNSECGMRFMESAMGAVRLNKVTGNRKGVVITGEAHPDVEGNTITKSSEAGIEIAQMGGGTFSSNACEGNTVGVVVLNPTLPKAVFRANSVSGNRVGVHCMCPGFPVRNRSQSLRSGSGTSSPPGSPSSYRKSSSAFGGDDTALSVEAIVAREAVKDTLPTFVDNTIDASDEINVLTESCGSAKFEGNRIEGCAIGVRATHYGLGDFKNNRISHLTLCGVQVWHHASPKFQHNRIHDAKHGIEVTDNGRGSFHSDHFKNNSVNIVVRSGGDPLVDACSIAESMNSAGLVVGAAGRGTYTSNRLSKNHGSGVQVTEFAAPVLRDNVIEQNGTHGVELHPHSKGDIEKNKICKNRLAGVHVQPGAETAITSNHVYENQIGIEVIDNHGAVIQRNKIHHNATYGLSIRNSTLHVTQNEVARESVGIFLHHEAKVNLVANVFRNCHIGCASTRSAEPAVSENLFVGNETGCYIDSKGSYTKNNFQNNLKGIVALGGQPKITHNRIEHEASNGSGQEHGGRYQQCVGIEVHDGAAGIEHNYFSRMYMGIVTVSTRDVLAAKGPANQPAVSPMSPTESNVSLTRNATTLRALSRSFYAPKTQQTLYPDVSVTLVESRGSEAFSWLSPPALATYPHAISECSEATPNTGVTIPMTSPPRPAPPSDEGASGDTLLSLKDMASAMRNDLGALPQAHQPFSPQAARASPSVRPSRLTSGARGRADGLNSPRHPSAKKMLRSQRASSSMLRVSVPTTTSSRTKHPVKLLMSTALHENLLIDVESEDDGSNSNATPDDNSAAHSLAGSIRVVRAPNHKPPSADDVAVRIVANHFLHNENCIVFASVTSVCVVDNLFDNGLVGVLCSDPDTNPRFEQNRFLKMRVGCDVEDGELFTAFDCTFERNVVGALVKGSDSHPRFVGCVFDRNQEGIQCTEHSAPTIESCCFTGNHRVGVSVRDHAQPIIKGCVLSHHHGNHEHQASAIAVEKTGGGSLTSNAFLKNEVGVSLLGCSAQVTRNVFKGSVVAGVRTEHAPAAGIEAADIFRNLFTENAVDVEASASATARFRLNCLSSPTAVVAKRATRAEFEKNVLLGQIRIHDASDPTFRNNLISKLGVLVTDGGFGFFDNNTFYRQDEGDGRAMFEVRSGAPRLKGNAFHLCTKAFASTGEDCTATLVENKFFGGKIGVELKAGSTYLGDGNRLESQERGIVVTGGRSNIEKCDVANAQQVGITIDAPDETLVSCVHVFDSRVGVLVKSGSKGLFKDCGVFDNHSTGVWLAEDTVGAKLVHCKVQTGQESGALHRDGGSTAQLVDCRVRHQFTTAPGTHQLQSGRIHGYKKQQAVMAAAGANFDKRIRAAKADTEAGKDGLELAAKLEERGTLYIDSEEEAPAPAAAAEKGGKWLTPKPPPNPGSPRLSSVGTPSPRNSTGSAVPRRRVSADRDRTSSEKKDRNRSVGFDGLGGGRRASLKNPGPSPRGSSQKDLVKRRRSSYSPRVARGTSNDSRSPSDPRKASLQRAPSFQAFDDDVGDGGDVPSPMLRPARGPSDSKVAGGKPRRPSPLRRHSVSPVPSEDPPRRAVGFGSPRSQTYAKLPSPRSPSRERSLRRQASVPRVASSVSHHGLPDREAMRKLAAEGTPPSPMPLRTQAKRSESAGDIGQRVVRIDESAQASPKRSSGDAAGKASDGTLSKPAPARPPRAASARRKTAASIAPPAADPPLPARKKTHRFAKSHKLRRRSSVFPEFKPEEVMDLALVKERRNGEDDDDYMNAQGLLTYSDLMNSPDAEKLGEELLQEQGEEAGGLSPFRLRSSSVASATDSTRKDPPASGASTVLSSTPVPVPRVASAASEEADAAHAHPPPLEKVLSILEVQSEVCMTPQRMDLGIQQEDSMEVFSFWGAEAIGEAKAAGTHSPTTQPEDIRRGRSARRPSSEDLKHAPRQPDGRRRSSGRRRLSTKPKPPPPQAAPMLSGVELATSVGVTATPAGSLPLHPTPASPPDSDALGDTVASLPSTAPTAPASHATADPVPAGPPAAVPPPHRPAPAERDVCGDGIAVSIDVEQGAMKGQGCGAAEATPDAVPSTPQSVNPTTTVVSHAPLSPPWISPQSTLVTPPAQPLPPCTERSPLSPPMAPIVYAPPPHLTRSPSDLRAATKPARPATGRSRPQTRPGTEVTKRGGASQPPTMPVTPKDALCVDAVGAGYPTPLQLQLDVPPPQGHTQRELRRAGGDGAQGTAVRKPRPASGRSPRSPVHFSPPSVPAPPADPLPLPLPLPAGTVPAADSEEQSVERAGPTPAAPTPTPPCDAVEPLEMEAITAEALEAIKALATGTADAAAPAREADAASDYLAESPSPIPKEGDAAETLMDEMVAVGSAAPTTQRAVSRPASGRRAKAKNAAAEPVEVATSPPAAWGGDDSHQLTPLQLEFGVEGSAVDPPLPEPQMALRTDKAAPLALPPAAEKKPRISQRPASATAAKRPTTAPSRRAKPAAAAGGAATARRPSASAAVAAPLPAAAAAVAAAVAESRQPQKQQPLPADQDKGAAEADRSHQTDSTSLSVRQVNVAAALGVPSPRPPSSAPGRSSAAPPQALRVITAMGDPLAAPKDVFDALGFRNVVPERDAGHPIHIVKQHAPSHFTQYTQELARLQMAAHDDDFTGAVDDAAGCLLPDLGEPTAHPHLKRGTVSVAADVPSLLRPPTGPKQREPMKPRQAALRNLGDWAAHSPRGPPSHPAPERVLDDPTRTEFTPRIPPPPAKSWGHGKIAVPKRPLSGKHPSRPPTARQKAP